MPDRTRWWRFEGMAESDHGHSWLVKATIVVIVFPVLLVSFMQRWKLVVLGLAWMLPADAAWAHWVGWCAVVVGVILAGWVSFWICRLIWPKSASPSRA
jgi:uncharacterized membrane protein YdjX (TVP38/TMEM64 family)